MQRKLILLVLVLALAFGTGIAGAQEKILEIGMQQEPDGFGTMFSMVAATQVEAMIYSGLLYRDDEWDLHPNNAVQQPNVGDGTWIVNEEEETMTVHWQLRDDVYWQDGTPMTTDDYILGYNVHMHPDYPAITKTVAGYIEEIEVLGDYEMKIHYNQLYPFADQVLGFMAKPAHIFQDYYDNDNITAIVEHEYWRTGFFGPGPYKIAEWVAGSHIELVANENYHLGEPNIDVIVVRFVEDSETLRFMIETGEVQASIGPTLPFDTSIALQRSVDPEVIHVEFYEATAWEHIDLNNRDFEPFDDPRVRRALMHATDREEIMETVFEGVISPAHTFQTEVHPLFSEEAAEIITTYEYNPERAEALLAAAGFVRDEDGIMTHQESGEKMILDFRTTAGNATRELAQQIIAEQWSEVGIQVEINNMTAGALFDPEHFYRREWPNMILFAWLSYPTSLPNTLWHKDNIPRPENNWEGQNVAGWYNEEASAIIDEMMNEMDPQRRVELNTRLLQLWTYEIPSLPLFFRVEAAFWHTDVTGIKPTGSADPDTWNVHEWDIQ